MVRYSRLFSARSMLQTQFKDTSIVCDTANAVEAQRFFANMAKELYKLAVRKYPPTDDSLEVVRLYEELCDCDLRRKIMKKTSGLALFCLTLIATLFWSVWQFSEEEPIEGIKDIMVQVIHSDESLKEFTFSTSAKYLADALVEQKIVENTQEAYGLYILTADGETANEESQEWWCITKAGEAVSEGASSVVIKDGDQYELTLVKGYK